MKKDRKNDLKKIFVQDKTKSMDPPPSFIDDLDASELDYNYQYFFRQSSPEEFDNEEIIDLHFEGFEEIIRIMNGDIMN